MNRDMNRNVNRAKTKHKRRNPYKTARNKLDAAFSLYIRRRDCDEKGYGNCITCLRRLPLQCGHFVRRQHAATRWDERNAHGQCAYCNKRLHGNEGAYALAIIDRYGESVLRELLHLKTTTAKFTRADLTEMAEDFATRTQALADGLVV